MEQDPDNLSALFKALSHKERFSLLTQIASHRDTGITPSALQDLMGVSPSYLSFHLKELSEAKLITAQKKGRQIYYFIHYEQAHFIIKTLAQHLLQTDKLKITVTKPAYCKTES